MTAAAPDAPSQPAAVNPSPLSKLPQELAEMVYAWALVSGNTNVLRLSRQSNQAASFFRFRAGIFRINAQEYPYESVPNDLSIRNDVSIQKHQISTQTANSIQNVEIRVEICSSQTPSLGGHLPGPLAHFMDPDIRRDTCYVTLKSNMARAHHYKPMCVLSRIQRLRGFKTVIVRAVARDEDDGPVNPVFTRVRERLMCEMVRDELEEVFGPGVMHKSDEQGRKHLEFRPMRN